MKLHTGLSNIRETDLSGSSSSLVFGESISEDIETDPPVFSKDTENDLSSSSCSQNEMEQQDKEGEVGSRMPTMGRKKRKSEHSKQVEDKSTHLHLLFSEQDNREFRAKCIQMRSIFFLLKNGRHMREYPELRELLIANKCPSCPLYHWSISAGWEFAGFMNEALQGELRSIVQYSSFLSLSVDEVIAVDNTSWAAIHLYNVVEYERKSHFLGIFKLRKSSNGETLYNVIVDHLSSVAGMSARDCANKLICFGADGASVMQGNRSALGVRIQTNLAPYLQVIHCISHRSNLAYKIISDAPHVSKVELLVKRAYKFSCKSPQTCATFNSLAGLTDNNYKLKGVATKWISLYAPVKRLCEEYASVVDVIEESAFNDHGRTAIKAERLYDLLTDGETMLTLFALQPLLGKLHHLIAISQDGNFFTPEYNIARKRMQSEIENLYVDDVKNGQSCFEHNEAFTLWRKFVQIGSIHSFLAYNERGVLCVHVRDKYMEMYIRKPRGPYNNQMESEFKMEDFGYVVDKVKRHMAQVANDLVAEVYSGFPSDELLDAIGIVFPHCWNHAHSKTAIAESFKAKAKVIKEHFCCEKSFSDGRIEGLLNFDKLKAQAPVFGDTMYKQFLELENPLEFTAVSRLWQKLGSNSLLHVSISEYFRLAELCLCMVLGSVQDEKCFSTLKFVKRKLKNRLDGNVDATLRLYACYYNIADFPYEKAFQLWNGSCKHRVVSEEDINTTFMLDG